MTDDPERLARLEREARILASLNHPSIAGLHDIGQAEGVHYLVMELAPGESLDARIARGPVSLDDAQAFVEYRCMNTRTLLQVPGDVQSGICTGSVSRLDAQRVQHHRVGADVQEGDLGTHAQLLQALGH